MNQEAECQGGRRVERSGRGGGSESAVGVNDEAADEMEVRVDAMLLGQLYTRILEKWYKVSVTSES